MIEVANLTEMCQILRMDVSTGRKHWRTWPHFFPTAGRDARSARFVPEQVVAALMKYWMPLPEKPIAPAT